MQYTDYNEFLEKLEQLLIEFMEQQQNMDISHVHYLRNNGVVREDLQVIAPGSQVGRVLDPRPLFARHLAGTEIEQLAREVVELCFDDAPEEIIKVWQSIKDYDKIKDRIFIRLINMEENSTLLSLCPYVKVLDLAVTFRIEIRNTDEGLMSMTVDHTMLSHWGICKDLLYSDALANTQKRFPGQIIPIHRMIDEEFMECLKTAKTEQERSEMEEAVLQWRTLRAEATKDLETDYMFAVTNEQKINGASAILYTGFIRRFSARIASDLYLLPSSIHEMMIVPVKHWEDPGQLRAIVKEVNDSVVKAEERLGEHIYRYTYETDEITVAV